jgi:hypothetical protein
MSFWDSLTGSPNTSGDNIDAGGGFNPGTGQTTGGVLDTISGILAPEKIRTQISGLYAGGIKSFLTGKAPGVNIKPLGINTSGSAADIKDWRVRVSLPPKSALHYDNTNPFLNILSRTDGVVFPYTPNITVTHNARYQEQALTHSNYKNYFYEGSDVSAINIVGDFTVQNKDDALYVLAAVYFFRSCTKMFFGADINAGNPPPIVYLDGYGDYYFPHVTCVVTSFQHTMPADVDYIEVAYSQGSDTKIVGTSYVSNKNRQTARVPVSSQFNVTLQPIYSRKNVATNMTLGNFSQGKLLKGKGGFI